MEPNIIKVETVINKEDWDSNLEQFKGSVYQCVGFLFSLKSDVIKPVFLKFFKEGKVIAMLSGIEVLMGNLNEKQLLFYAGLAIHEKTNEIIKACKDALVNFASTNGYSRMVFRSYDDTNYQNVKADKYYVLKRREEAIIDLSKDNKDLEKGFSGNVRRDIKKAKSTGLHLKQGSSPDLLNRLMELLNTTQKVRKEKGYGTYSIFALPFIDEKVMLKLLQSNAATLYYVQFEEEIVSMIFTLKAMGRAYVIYMGNSPRGYKLAAPSLLFYDVAFDLKEKGFYSYNIGGVTIGTKNEGIKKFKLRMGSVLFQSGEEKTYFLQPNLKKYNKLLHFKIYIRHTRIPGKLKKLILRFTNLLMGHRDNL